MRYGNIIAFISQRRNDVDTGCVDLVRSVVELFYNVLYNKSARNQRATENTRHVVYS